jgi:hypothetical protein
VIKDRSLLIIQYAIVYFLVGNSLMMTFFYHYIVFRSIGVKLPIRDLPQQFILSLLILWTLYGLFTLVLIYRNYRFVKDREIKYGV